MYCLGWNVAVIERGHLPLWAGDQARASPNDRSRAHRGSPTDPIGIHLILAHSVIAAPGSLR